MYIPVARLLVFFCTVYQDLIDRGGISKQINWTLFNLRNDYNFNGVYEYQTIM